MFQFRRFPSYAYLFQRRMTAYCAAGLPHSDISGSLDICSSPKLFAACHVLHRLLMPRHSPCALSSLTCSSQSPLRSVSAASLSASVENSARSLASRLSPKTGFRRVETGVTGVLSGLAPSCQRILVLFENYAGFTKIDEIVVTLHPSRCISTINLLRRMSPHGASLLPYLLLSHCSVFKVQSRKAFAFPRFPSGSLPALAVRFEDPILPDQVFKSNGNPPGGPEWARTTDLTIISRTL